ncbi:hypothetical protein ABZ543_13040 [Streptomyces roseifaciens]
MAATPSNPFDLRHLNADQLHRRSIDQTADDYHDLKALKNPETAKRYRRELAFFFRFMRRAQVDPTHATQPQVVAYLSFLASETHPDHDGDHLPECAHLPYSPAARQHRLAVLSDFYEYAAANQQVTANPCRGLSVDVPKKNHVDHLTWDEADTFWNEAKAHSWRDGTLSGLLLGCGMRKEEVRQARIEPIPSGKDKGRGGLRKTEFGPGLEFYRVKGGYWQTIPLPAPVWSVVQRQVGDRTSGPILCSRRKAVNPHTQLLEAAHLTDAGIDYILHQIRDYSGVRPDDFYAHLARYTSITFSRTTRGLPLAVTMTFYGHASKKDHDRYDAFARDTFTRQIINPAQGPDFWRFALAA